MGSGPRPRHCAIATPLDVPIRVAPFAIMRSAVAQSRTPPDAFTPIASPTTRRMSATASALAPPAAWNPVLVFTYCAPASRAMALALMISTGVRCADSMMTFTSVPPRRADHGANVVGDVVPVTALDVADRGDHVDLRRALADRQRRLGRLDLRLVRA